MDGRNMFYLALVLLVYCLYCFQMWLVKQNPEEDQTKSIKPAKKVELNNFVIPKNETTLTEQQVKVVVVPLVFVNACSVLDVFTQKPVMKMKKQIKKDLNEDNDNITSFVIIVLLVIMILNALVDVIKVKEEERARKKLIPEGERRQSLSEFANKKNSRQESTKYSFNLFQIAESPSNEINSDNEEKKTRRQTRPVLRGESTNSYLTDKKKQHDSSGPSSICESIDGEKKHNPKRQSVSKIFGGRPVPMIRRSSFPALPLNPEVQALMLNNRQQSVDSDDDSDGKGRRVRIIRRF